MVNETEPKNTMIELTRGGLLARNTLLNIVFQAVPLVIALVTIPILIRGLGTDRFGVLSIAWMFMGYFSLFDFGISRVLIKMVGEKLAAEQTDDIPPLYWTGFIIMTVIGVVVSVIVFIVSPWLVYNILKIPQNLLTESLLAFKMIALSVPLVITTAALWGVMEACQRFLPVNCIRVLNSALTLVLPIIILQFTQNIGYIVLSMTLGRLLLWFVSLFFSFSVLPILRKRFILSKSVIRPIIRLGFWMTISNIISPLMVYFDRFLIGAIISVTAVTYYVTPYEVVTKLLMVAVALNRVLFPAFSVSQSMQPERAFQIYDWGRKTLFIILFPVILSVIVLAENILGIWVGSDFVKNSTFIMQCIAIGVFFNAQAQVSFGLIQAAGKPNITAKLHLVEFPLYFSLLWILVHQFGINGAAVAWMIRTILDSVLLFFFADRILNVKKQNLYNIGIASAFIIFFLAVLPDNIIIKIIFVTFFIVVYIAFSWYGLLDNNLRTFLIQKFNLLVKNKF
ncbi:flippase [candidate division KSB1 bacterium]|nr:flippase [candidate division KSB1 bacterium]